MKENKKQRLDYSTNPQGSAIPEFPEYITILSDGTYKVELRQITGVENKYDYFIIEDMPGRKMNSLYDRSRNSKGEIVEEKMMDLLVQNAIVYPIITPEEWDDMKSSDILRITNAIGAIYDTESFM